MLRTVRRIRPRRSCAAVSARRAGETVACVKRTSPPFIEEPEAYQREHGTDDEHHNANDGGHLVVVLLLRQAEQPCDQQIHLFCTGGSQRLILGDINVLREQIDDVEVVDVAHKIRYQRGPCTLSR